MPAFHSAAYLHENATGIGVERPCWGPLIVGLDKPIQIVQLGATDAEIVNMRLLPHSASALNGANALGASLFRRPRKMRDIK